jgi:hypothetical protein
MNEEPMTVAELAEAFDVMNCAECNKLRAEIELIIDSAPGPALASLRRWQQHKDDRHPQFSRYLRHGDD